MSAPVRIQRKRERGWRMPPDAIYVGRPSRWGNPYRAGDRDPYDGRVMDVPGAVEAYRHWLWPQTRTWDFLRPLVGHDLVCWCPLDQPCHADVLLELANQP